MQKPCKSGLHKWEHTSKNLEKCCNGFIPIKVPMKNAGYLQWETDEGNLDPWLNKDGTRREGAIFKTVMVPEIETERIKLLRACEPSELAKLWRSQPN